jgi:hypothetical protein
MEDKGRNEHFNDGRFYEHTQNVHSGWDHIAAFQDHEGNSASVGTHYVAEVHQLPINKDYASGEFKVDLDASRDYDHDGQGLLLRSKKAEHVVETLYTAPGARHHIPTLLGMAAMHSIRKTGQLPGASESLSTTSAPLVQKLVNKGLLKNPTADDYGSSGWNDKVQVTNRIDPSWGPISARDAVDHVKSNYGSEADPRNVTAGRQFSRAVLRSPRKVNAQESHQMELF